MKTAIFLLICGVSVVGCDRNSDSTQTQSSGSSSTPATAPAADTSMTPTTQPDNTAINSRDQAAGAVTAGMQGQSKSDVDMTAEVRQRVMAAKMSVNAENAKIICQSGKMTLRGPVNSQDEKDSIGKIANDVAGPANVDNELDVKPNG